MLGHGTLIKGGVSFGRPELTPFGMPAQPMIIAKCLCTNGTLPFITMDHPAYVAYVASMEQVGMTDAGSLFFMTKEGRVCLDYLRAQTDLAAFLRDNGASRCIPESGSDLTEHGIGIICSMEENEMAISSDPAVREMYRRLIAYHNRSVRNSGSGTPIDPRSIPAD